MMSHSAPGSRAMYCSGTTCVSTTSAVITTLTTPIQRGSEPWRSAATAVAPALIPMAAQTQGIVL